MSSRSTMSSREAEFRIRTWLQTGFLTAVFAALPLAGMAQDAPSLYVAEDGVELQGEPGEDALAYLRVLSEVTVLESSGDFTRVSVQGWTELDADGNPTETVYTNREDRMQSGQLGASGNDIIESTEDGWAEVRLSGQVRTDALTEDPAPLHDQARQIYQRQCTLCHAGYAPPLEVILQGRAPHQWPDRRSHAMESGISEQDLNLFMRWAQAESKAQVDGDR